MLIIRRTRLLLHSEAKQKYILIPGDSVAPQDATMFSGKSELRSVPFTIHRQDHQKVRIVQE